MSRTLKRPMFRKGGEVMEGIMTGIKPREKFLKGSKDPRTDMFGNITEQMNLIDKVAGVGDSPLSDPLTQFLLSYGPALVGGEAAGGSKLQEIVGAAKTPLATAIKAQTLKDAGRRKLAASLIGKSKIGEATAAYKDYGYAMKNDKTGEKFTLEEFIPFYAQRKLSDQRKSKSAEDIAYETATKEAENLVNQETIPDITFEGAKKSVAAKNRLKEDVQRDLNKYYVQPDESAEGGFGEDIKQIIQIKPDNVDDYKNGFYYYNYNNNSWYRFDGEKLEFKFKG